MAEASGERGAVAGQSQAGSRISEDGLSDWSIIGEGADAVVRRSPGDDIVRKGYLGNDLDERVALADREYDALVNANAALATIDGARSLTPIMVDRTRGELVLEYFSGSQLDKAIGGSDFDDLALQTDIARRLANAISALTEALPLNQLDFSIRNTMLSEDGQELVLIDFTSRSKPVLLPEGGQEIESAIASFVTSSTTYQIRRSSALDRTRGRRLQTIATEMIRTIGNKQAVNLDSVRQIAWKYYWRQSGNRGWKRYLWFHSFGAIMFWYLLERCLSRV